MSKEEISITGSQHERTWNIDEWTPRNSEEFYGAIQELTKEQLVEMGFMEWEDIHLIPYEWYDKIPEGAKVVDILGKEEVFSKATHGDDHRYGCLAYGVKLD